MKTSPNSSRVSRWRRARQGFLLGCGVSIVVLLLWSSNAFAQLRLRLSDTYFVPAPVSNNIVLIAIDDATLEAYGRSLTDWSRDIYANLINFLSAAQARVVAFDILFVDHSTGDAELANAIQQARTSDARTRTVMPAVGVQQSGVLVAGNQAVRYDEALLPTESLLQVVDYIGYVNTYPDVDGSIRRRPSLIEVNSQVNLSLSLAAYLAYLRIPSAAVSQIVVPHGETLEVTTERSIPVDQYGFWVQNYFGPPYSSSHVTFPVVSMVDVLNGMVDSSLFNDKIVMVGVINASVIVDAYFVPSSTSGRLMSGVEIHANALETLIQNRFLTEQSPSSQVLMIVALSVIASTIYMQFRWYWIVPVALLLLISWVLLTFMLFNSYAVIVNLFHSGLALLFPVLATTGWNISLEVWRRRNTEFLLRSVVESSSQRLSLDRVLQSLADDVRKLLPDSRGGIWLWEDDKRALKKSYEWDSPPQTSEALCLAVLEARSLVQQDERVGVPMVWQGRLIGIIAAHLPEGKRAGENALSLLHDLSQRIAPNLENASLYTRLEQQKTLLEAVLFGSPAGILVLDHAQRIIRSNALASKLLPLVNTPGKTLNEILQGVSVNEESLSKIRAGLADTKSFQQEIRIDVHTFNLAAAPLTEFKQWVIILNDVTVLAELNQLKTRLMRLATHDLKNPLGRVLGYSHAVLEVSDDMHDLPDRYRSFIQNVVKAGEDMNRIITDILNSEQVRSTVFTRDPVDLAAVMREALVHFQTGITNKRQTVTQEVSENLPRVSGNGRYLTQVISNLISNATKYTPEGGSITIRLYQPDPSFVRLEVVDTGYGISEEAQVKLFTDFFRIRTAATAHVTGTGLGLSLSKWIVEAHGGRIWVQSKPDEGSTFFVELPVIQEVQNAAPS